MKYDYLIVGAGLSGAIFAYEATKKGYKCLVIEKRSHIGGNLYCENIEGIQVHKYGAHIFRTNDKEIWDYINQFVSFNHYINSPIAKYKNKIYNLPFNMNTFYQIYGAKTPIEAMRLIDRDRIKNDNPKNLEECAINLVGKKIYKKLIKGYTEKQWGRKCKKLPASIIKRLPLRFIYDNNYFNDRYQGIPIEGYNTLFNKLLDGVDVILNEDYNKNKSKYEAKHIVYTGALDEYYDYKHGFLEYRSLRFEEKVYDTNNYQGNAVVNYTERKVPYTRTIEHKHFVFDTETPKTVVTYEYPDKWEIGKEKYYPINDDRNNKLYETYRKMADEEGLILCGRLADYKYYDMQDTIRKALEVCDKYLTGK